MSEVTISNARLTRDPEVKSYNGKEFLSLAVAENYKQNGEKQTRFWDVTMPGTKVAEFIEKGSLVTVRGTFSVSQKDGKQYYKCMGNAFGDLIIHKGKAKQEDGGDLPPF
jgi:single-stranded DNA-binding protein